MGQNLAVKGEGSRGRALAVGQAVFPQVRFLIPAAPGTLGQLARSGGLHHDGVGETVPLIVIPPIQMNRSPSTVVEC